MQNRGSLLFYLWFVSFSLLPAPTTGLLFSFVRLSSHSYSSCSTICHFHYLGKVIYILYTYTSQKTKALFPSVLVSSGSTKLINQPVTSAPQNADAQKQKEFARIKKTRKKKTTHNVHTMSTCRRRKCKQT